MPEDPGLLVSLRQLFSTLTDIAATRLALLANEWEEERLRLLQLFLFALCTAVCFAIACVLIVIFVVVLFWDEHRFAVLGLMGGLFSLVGVMCLIGLNTRLRSGSKVFSASLAELQQDRAQLKRTDE
jgi:uncharacterized membrane protein YqjE